MSDNIRKIGLVWANPFSTNLGVSALTYSALAIFDEIANARGLEFKYFLWGAPSTDTSIDLGGKNISFQSRPAYYVGDIIDFIKTCIRRPWKLIDYRHIATLKGCDYLADLGEGDSYADIYGIRRFRVFNNIKKRCIDGKRPYVLLPQTIGPFKSFEAISKARKSLTSASLVIARDKQSYDFSKELSSDINLVKSIDMAFFLPYEKKVVDNNRKVRVGINVSGLLWEGGYTQDNQFNLRGNYQDLIIRILDYFNDDSKYEVHLVGHVIGSDLDIDEDYHVLKQLKQRYPSFILAPRFENPIEAKTYISGLDFFAGARMHACIAAISSGVPVFPMAYSRKFNGLFCDTLQYPLMGDMVKQTDEEIFDNLINAFSDRDIIKDRIKQIQNEIINPEKERMIKLISSSIK